MKANAPKRKVFADAVDLLMDPVAEAAVSENGIVSLPVDGIRAFHDHPFHLYEGERLQDMVDSIREHGVLNPVIVRKVDGGYEMLSGHNRQNAAKLAGLAEIPAIVKADISDEEAYVYVIETNLMQRSFTDLSITEKAAVLAERYDKVLYQRNREDIIRELKELEGDTKGGHDVHLSKNRDGLGEEYGLSGRSVARLLRVNELVPELKEKLDNGSLSLVAAVQLSYVPEDVQREVAAVRKPISKEIATKIREEGVEVIEKLEECCLLQKEEGANISVKIPRELYNKYFHDLKQLQVQKIIEQALNKWFQ